MLVLVFFPWFAVLFVSSSVPSVLISLFRSVSLIQFAPSSAVSHTLITRHPPLFLQYISSLIFFVLYQFLLLLSTCSIFCSPHSSPVSFLCSLIKPPPCSMSVSAFWSNYQPKINGGKKRFSLAVSRSLIIISNKDLKTSAHEIKLNKIASVMSLVS